MTKTKLLLSLFGMVLLASAFASAGTIIYDNGGPNQQNGNEMTAWVQTEDFKLASNQTVTSIHFWDIEGAPGYAGSITWWIVGDDGNGNPNFNNILGSGSVNPTRVNTQCGVLGVFCEFSNDWNINGIALTAGVEYHLALHNGDINHQSRDEFYWETTNANNSNTGLECGLPTACFGSWFNNGQEHAFYLDGGTGVPEPGTLVMMGTGVLGLAGAIRRKLF